MVILKETVNEGYKGMRRWVYVGTWKRRQLFALKWAPIPGAIGRLRRLLASCKDARLGREISRTGFTTGRSCAPFYLFTFKSRGFWTYSLVEKSKQSVPQVQNLLRKHHKHQHEPASQQAYANTQIRKSLLGPLPLPLPDSQPGT
jgi:hypothetical protein